MNKELLPYFAAISTISEVGSVRFKQIINHFSDVREFFSCSSSDLVRAGLTLIIAERIIISRNQLKIDQIWQRIEKEEIGLLTFFDDEYPALLKEIYDFPPLLYYRGNLDCFNNSSLAVVGTRKMSHYGQDVTNQLVGDLASAGLTIVSGLALGVDSCAHQATLKAKGKTIAVLGTGIDRGAIYPHQNKRLAEKIIERGGLVISEFPCGMVGHKHNFPMRNRIISGLSLGTLVIEAGRRSGALITAQLSLDHNREVLAVPGSVQSPVSIGTNNLIKQGAKVVTEANDILNWLDLTLVRENATILAVKADSNEEKIILDLLSKEPIAVDQLILQSGLSSQQTSAILTVMELAGKIRDVGGKNYIIN